MELIERRTNRLRQIHNDIVLLASDVATATTTTWTECNTNFVSFEYVIDERPDNIFDSTDRGRSDANDSNELNVCHLGGDLFDEDFFKRKIDEMMSGTLEMCWEDEIKKDPPKPNCLQRAIREVEYTETDRIEVAEYIKKMRELKESRAEYVQRLIEEAKTLRSSLEMQTIQFNNCIGNALLSKIRTEFAIKSEELRLLMPSVDHSRYRQLETDENR